MHLASRSEGRIQPACQSRKSHHRPTTPLGASQYSGGKSALNNAVAPSEHSRKTPRRTCSPR
eukprot:1344216-Pyramimonas_sp.AAC.1